jgi:long-chain fatty acid transport protein
MKTCFKILVVCASMAPSVSFGLGLRIPDQDARAIASGNAFVATADNPSAIYYNPAGIANLEGNNMRLGAYGIWLQDRYTANNGTHFDTENDFQTVPQVYYSYKNEKCPFAFGFGFYAPYGLGIEWPQNSSFRTLITEAELSYLTMNPVIAWQIVPSLSIAIGPTVNYADIDLQQGILRPGDEYRFRGDDVDVGFNAGLLWQPHQKHSFGVSYRSATTMDFHGSTDIYSYVAAIPSGSSSATMKQPYPQNVIAGYSFRPTPAWNLEFNLDWTDWDRLNTVVLKRSAGETKIVYNWNSSFLYEFGVTRSLGEKYSVSAGYIFSENTVPDETYTPAVPDSNRHIFSAGVGYHGKRWLWDAAYQFAYGPTRTVSNSISTSAIGQTADGKYEFFSHAFTCSIGLKF